MGVIKKVAGVLWFIASPFALYFFVTNFIQCIGLAENELSEQMMNVIIMQIVCIILLAWGRFSGLLHRRGGGSAHVTVWDVVFSLFLAPVKLAFCWVVEIIFLIIGVLKGLFSGLFGKSGKSGGDKRAANAAQNRGESDDARGGGSDGKLKRWIENALPRRCPSWPYGHTFVDSVSTEISAYSNKVIVSGRLRFVYSGSAEGAASQRSALQSSMESTAKDFANALCNAAYSAFGKFREQYSGYDDEWQIQPGDIEYKLEF